MSSAPISAEKVLNVLDEGARNSVFPMLDNGYIYPAASRLTLYRSAIDWALAFEIFGFSPRAGIPDLNVTTFGSRLANSKGLADFVSEEAYRSHLELHPHDATTFFYPIEDDAWIDQADGEHVREEADQLKVAR